MTRSRHLILIILIALFSLSAWGQLPHADWKTIETAHFRFHFPAEYEAWTRLAAERMESIRARLIEDIGYAPPQKVDVLVMDPMSQANGSAWPFLDNARMVLWTSPPGPESVIGNYADWIELLTVHEQAHLVHLLRPSRNPMQRLLSRVLPLGPIGVRAPRWVSEGYATVLEGDFTGSGRPNSAIRASILRKWAQAGALPSYGQMASDSRTFMGMSMAYLMGSAYLEWLRDREGPESLPNLWSRLTARQVRSFDAAFIGVYGDSPSALYDRFVAELTHSALQIEQVQRPFIREGDLWQTYSWATGEPSVSADGKRLVTVIRHREQPERMVILSTGENAEAEERWQEQMSRILERDPEDVAAVRRQPLARKPLDELHGRDRSEHFLTPRWIGDGRSILFGRFEPDFEGQLHPDLYRWTPGKGIERLTFGAGVRDADPAPDGSWAVAVRNRFGMSQIVKVELSTGAITEITPPAISPIYDSPRISPDGTQIVFVRHGELAWRLVVRDLTSGAERILHPASGELSDGEYSVAQPAWSVDGDFIYATLLRQGFMDLARISVESGDFERITTMRGAALAAAPSDDGVYFLSLENDGLDIRFLDAGSQPGASFEIPQTAWPLAGRTEPRTVVPFEVAELEPARDYGAGRQEASFLFGGSHSPSNDMFEIGMRMGDVIGRTNVLFLGSLGGGRGFEGGAIAGAWRGWPVELNGHVYVSDEKGVSDGQQAGLDRTGAEVGARWNRIWRNKRLEVGSGVLLQSIDGFGVDDEQGSIHLEPEFRGRLGFGSWHMTYGTSAWLETGRTGDDNWQRLIGSGTFGVEAGDTSLVIDYHRGSIDGDASTVDRFEVGGWRPSLLPKSALAARVAVPALDARALTGSEFESQAADLTWGGFPLSAFFERHRAFEEGASAGEWLELAGLRLNVSTDSLPLLGVAGIDLQLGVAQILTGTFEDDTNWWVTMAWRP